MTAISFSLSQDELHSPMCSSIMAKAKSLKTIQYTINPCQKFSISSMSGQICDISKLSKSQTVLVSFVISDYSFTHQRTLDLVQEFTDFISRTQVFRIDFDFTQFTGTNLPILEKLTTLVKSVQKIYEYKLFISISLPIGVYHGILDHELTYLAYFLKELIQISMIQFVIRSDLKRKSISWYQYLETIQTKVSCQFDDKYQRYFKHARKPNFAFKIHHNPHTCKNKFGEIELQQILTYCQEKEIASLSIKILPINYSKLDKKISSEYFEIVVKGFQGELELPTEYLNKQIEFLEFEFDDIDYLELPPYSSSGSSSCSDDTEDELSDDLLPTYMSLFSSKSHFTICS